MNLPSLAKQPIFKPKIGVFLYSWSISIINSIYYNEHTMKPHSTKRGGENMNVLIAPDSFKGSVTAKEAATSMKRGIYQVNPKTNVELVPMADGGEGTMISLVEATSGTIFNVEVQDPLGRNIIGEYGVMGDGKTAIIELASASGLQNISNEEQNPYITSTYGTGQLIYHALEQGFNKFVICLGGSSTNDGGAGILKALGFKFLDHNGNCLSEGGLALQQLKKIDTSDVKSVVRNATFQIACDVTNPLLGKNGASSIYGPQKGATAEMVDELDKSLMVFAEYVKQQKGNDLQSIPGAGAAGGTAFGLLAFLNAELKPGIDIVIEHTKFESYFTNQSVDLLLTGEGKIDAQTNSGKVVSGLAEMANRYNIPTVAIAGAIEENINPLYEKGLTAAFCILQEPMSLTETILNGEYLIEKSTEQVFRLVQGVRNKNKVL